MTIVSVAILFLSIVVPGAAMAASGTTLYVSQAGDDSNAGTSPAAPLATFGAAIVASRRLKPSSILLSGRFTLTEAATLNSQAQNIVISQWPDMPAAVFSGGVDLSPSAWTRQSASDIWSAPLTAEATAALANSSAGSIFVSGARRSIVRTQTLRWSKSLGTTGSAASKRGFIVARGTLDPEWSTDAASLSQWRVAAFHSWTKAYHTVKSVDAKSGTIAFGEEAMFGYGQYTYCSDRRFYIEGDARHV